MTTFINRNKPKKVEKKVTVFTHYMSEIKKEVSKCSNQPEDYKDVEYLYSFQYNDVFMSTNHNGTKTIHIGTKGDEFED